MFFKRLGIDLGTANSIVYLAGEGIVLNEPTVVAISLEDRRVLAIGRSARKMLGRTPGNIIASRPMRDGVIADYRVTEAMLRFFIQKVCGRSFLFKPEVMICVPSGVTQVEKRAVLDATMSAGARTAYLIDEPLAAAIGANIPIAEASGNMIVDIGGGSAEAGVISLGGVVVHESVRVAGNKIDEAIISYIKRKHNLLVGHQTAESIKIKIGNAMFEEELKNAPAQPKERAHQLQTKGRDTLSGMPRTITISSQEVTQAIRPVLNEIIKGIKKVLGKIPPELAADIIDKGIILSGGTSLLHNFDRLITQETGVPSFVTQDPMLCVARGTGIALENIDLYKRSLTKK